MTTARASIPAGAIQRVACDHCGLPVPRGLIEPDADHQFCCTGCRTVYETIRSCGLDAFYKIRDDIDAVPAESTGRGYADFDDPAFAERHVQTTPDGLATIELYLEGVHCAACVWLVEKLPTVVPGVVEARLAMRRSLVRVSWDPAAVPLSKIARTLDALGYPPHPARGADARSIRTATDRRMLLHIAIAGAVAGNAMLLAAALYAGYFGGIESEYARLFRWMSMGLGAVSLAWPGRVFFRGAWAAIRTRTPHLDLPIALGLTAGAVAGTINTVLDRGEIYFDSLTVLVFLLLVGRFIQHRQQRRADDAVELLHALTPTTAHRVDGDAVNDVPVEALQRGDIVEVRAGDCVPADGVIVCGESKLDRSILTGESEPVAAGVGDRVAAGTLNLSGVLRVRVESTGEATRAGRLMRIVEQAAQRKAPIVRFADRVSGWFVVTVASLAGVTFVGWAIASSATVAADHAAALLIVACPCALGLATPLVVAVAIGRSARRRVLVKGGDTFERLAKPGTVLLDKTGTITTGRTTLLEWHGDDSVRPLVAAIESRSTHPVARALVEAFGELPEPEVAELEVEQTGVGGIEATADGRRVRIGSGAFLASRNIVVPEWAHEAVHRCDDPIASPLYIAVDDAVVSVGLLGDAVRPDSAASIAALQKAGWKVGVLSGDDERIVRRIAEQVGVDPQLVHGGVMPEQKLEYVQSLDATGPVVMVGDGVNDAAALAAADVGIAVHGGAEAALAAADVYIDRPGLGPIVDLVHAARRTKRTLRRNLGASLAYNAFAVSLAMAGVIGPLVAAVLMPLSSLTVLAMALGSRTYAPSATGDR